MYFIKPLQKIEVVESDKICKPGSIGYIAAIDVGVRFNTNRLSIVFTRFGKGGKNRLSNISLVQNILDVSFIEDEGLQNSLKVCIQGYGPVRKASIVKPIPHSKNLLTMDTWDFMGYISAFSILLDKMKYRRNIDGHFHGPTYFHGGKLVEERMEDIPIEFLGYALCGKMGRPPLNTFLYNYFKTKKHRQWWLEKMYKYYAMNLRAHVIDKMRILKNTFTKTRLQFSDCLGLKASQFIKLDPHFEIKGMNDLAFYNFKTPPLNRVPTPRPQPGRRAYPRVRQAQNQGFITVNMEPQQLGYAFENGPVEAHPAENAIQEEVPSVLPVNPQIVIDGIDVELVRQLPSRPRNGDRFNITDVEGTRRTYVYDMAMRAYIKTRPIGE